MNKKGIMRKKTKYDDMSYFEILTAINEPGFTYGKDARDAHRALKKYGDGLALFMRYPDFPYLLSAFAGGFSAVTAFIIFLSWR